MAQAVTTDILVGGSRIVGRIRVDPGAIRGENGPHDPTLVVPIAIEMGTQPAGRMLALVRLQSRLHLTPPGGAGAPLGPPATLDLMDGLHARSLPQGQPSHTVDLRFPLTTARVERLERTRHAAAPGGFGLRFAFEGVVAWLRTTYGQGTQPTPEVAPPSPWGLELGLHSDLVVFWTTRIHEVWVGIETSAWVDRVLPGLGMDRVRMIEAHVPSLDPRLGAAAGELDAARVALDAGRYDDCLIRCRGLVRAWSRHLHATKERPVATILAAKAGWPADDPRRTLLDRLWEGVLGVTNASHHPEGRPATFAASAHDARLVFMLTALLCDYLGAMEERA